jgi:hypothetical protein
MQIYDMLTDCPTYSYLGKFLVALMHVPCYVKEEYKLYANKE